MISLPYDLNDTFPIQNGCLALNSGFTVIGHRRSLWGKQILYGDRFHATILVATGNIIETTEYVEYRTSDVLSLEDRSYTV